MSNTAKNLIVVLGLITVAFGAYYIFKQSTADSVSFEADGEMLADIQTRSQLFIQRGRELQAIKLDLSFFSDERFRSLRSFDTPIIEPAVGRDNPFEDTVEQEAETN